jgi:AraC-like DNA-binding protein
MYDLPQNVYADLAMNSDQHSGNATRIPERNTVVRRDADGNHLDEAVAFYEHLHTAHAVTLTPTAAPFSYRVRSVGDDIMRLRSSTLTANRWGMIEPVGRYLLTWPQRGPATIDAGTDTEHVLTPGTAAMYPTGRPLTLTAPAFTVLHAADFDATYLELLDADRRGAVPRPLKFRPKPEPTALSALQRRMSAAAPDLLRPETDPRHRSILINSISRLLLEAFVEDDDNWETNRYPGRVGRAMQHIADHRAELLTTADIAAAAGMSERGLQQAFRQSDLPTPIVVLRHARLRGARYTLQHADPTTTSVSAVAKSWGFGHLGRFAEYYLREFEEYPSVTLRVNSRKNGSRRARS